jgi:hypothetical protein
MTKPRYVQHISGHGEKWEICESYSNDQDYWNWAVYGKEDRSERHFLPKSEYRECLPTRRRVTGEISIEPNRNGASVLSLPDGWAIERRKWLSRGRHWKLVTREDLAPGEVCIVIEEEE